MKMYVAGEWIVGRDEIVVRNPFDGSTLESVPLGEPADVERAVAGAIRGAPEMARLGGYNRSAILRKAAALLRERQATFARTLTQEEGKTLAEAQFEVSRAVETLELSADEAKRIEGTVLAVDGAPGGHGKLGFTLRVPCGVVAAITPFNFPLNLVCHKVGPALAAGNAVVLKPASDTPLSALALVELLLEAGLPPLGIACVTGPGKILGEALARDPRVRKLSFTGSRDVGERLCQIAGLKRVTMELGSNSPLIVLPDADLEQVVAATLATGYGNAGQTCISTQRVIALNGTYPTLVDRLTERVGALRAGNPLDPATQMGPMIREADAQRVQTWVREAVEDGARLVVGGERDGALLQPCLVVDVPPTARISCDELFGPAVALVQAHTLDEAIHLANDSRYGLSAGLFTRDLQSALTFIRRVQAGNLHVNWGPGWRADLMPYGGLKDSGFGKEGPHYAVQEMTELKTVVIHGTPV